MKRSLIILILFFGFSCSKNSDNGDTTDTTTLSLPKTISLVYDTGEYVHHGFVYNSEQQIEQITTERNSGTDVTKVEYDFNYAENGQLNEVLSTNLDDGTELNVVFDYSQQNVLTGLVLLSDGIATELDVFNHGEGLNSYSIHGDLGNLPTDLDFDTENKLTQLTITDINYVPTYSIFDKGIFHDVNLQPAVHVWHGFLFYLLPWELHLFSQIDMESLLIEENNYFYTEKLRDGQGNLTTFKMESQALFGFTIDYTIDYENRTF